jgi:hypothetical protein
LYDKFACIRSFRGLYLEIAEPFSAMAITVLSVAPKIMKVKLSAKYAEGE